MIFDMTTIIIHSRTKEKISGTYCFEWSEHKFYRPGPGEMDVRSRLVTKSKAREIITKLGLVVSYKTADGEIYDTPEGDLKKLFPGGIRTQYDFRTIEKVDNV